MQELFACDDPSSGGKSYCWARALVVGSILIGVSRKAYDGTMLGDQDAGLAARASQSTA
jgi:hypothetical protein